MALVPGSFKIHGGFLGKVLRVETDYVVIEFGPNREVLREGEVIAQDGIRRTVRWVGAAEPETVDLGTRGDVQIRQFLRGSLEHRAVTDEAFAQLLDDDPLGLFLEVLGTARKRRSSTQLNNAVAELGFPRDDVSKAWRKIRSALLEHPEVEVSADGKLKAVWTTPAKRLSDKDRNDDRESQGSLETIENAQPAAAVTGPASPTDSTLTPVEPDVGQRQPPERRETAVSSVEVSRSEGEQVRPTNHEDHPTRMTVEKYLHLLVTGRLGAATTGRPEADGSPAPDDEVARVLTAAVIGTLETAAARRLAMHPLASARRLAEFSDEVLRALRHSTGDQAAALVLGALPRRSNVADELDLVGLIGDEGVRHLLGSARQEIRGGSSRQAAAHQHLVGRILSSSSLRTLTLDTLLELASTQDDSSQGQQRLSDIVPAVAAALRRDGADRWSALDKATKSMFLRRVGRLPLADGTPRAKLIAAAGEILADDVAGAEWWENVRVDDLASLFDPRLMEVLERGDVRERIVAPLATAALNEASTRRRFGALLASTAPVAATMSPEKVAAAWRRVSTTDPHLRQWAEELRDVRGWNELKGRMAAIQGEVDQLQEQLAEARAEARVAADRAERLQERLSQVADATAGLRDSQTRQAKLDVMRALAELAAFVDGSAGRLESSRLSSRVASMVARQGLIPIGEHGSRVPFDPAVHEVVGPSPEPGAGVDVIRRGYNWTAGDEGVVLVRALVEFPS